MATETEAIQNPGSLLISVLENLSTVVAGVRTDQFADPTPCPEFNVEKLRTHILGWVTYFAEALTEGPAAETKPDAYVAPDDPRAAADVVRTAGRRIADAVEDGVADRPVTMLGSTMPGSAVLGMILGEYVVHGSDLAKATGQPWNPAMVAPECALTCMSGLLTDEYRGPDKSFGYQVDVAEDAPALDRLLGFAGRDPNWAATR